jgi:hypothetical protein
MTSKLTAITASAFLTEIQKNPAFCKSLDAPLTILDPLYIHNSPITHLSKHLVFKSLLNIFNCPNLRTATGRFEDGFHFDHCPNLNKIENMESVQLDQELYPTATFSNCPNLKIASGNFYRYVNFTGTGIEKIENLIIQSPNGEGYYACFLECPNLHNLDGWDASKDILIEQEKFVKYLSKTERIKEINLENIPNQITGNDFVCLILKDPDFCKTLTKPLTITGKVDLSKSNITTLSPLLTFQQEALFIECNQLEVATGAYEIFVSFKKSAVSKIENLQVTGFLETTLDVESADFSHCENLKIASGKFTTGVSFFGSGIESINNLEIEIYDQSGNYLYLDKCKNLQTLEGWDLSKKISIEPSKLEKEKRRRAALKKFVQDNEPKPLPFDVTYSPTQG